MVQLIVVSYGDVKDQKIPNFWTYLNIASFIILIFSYPEIYEFKFQTFFYSLVFLFVGFLLFLLKIMGGGDSKYLAAFYLLIPLNLQENAILKLLISTVIIGAFFLITNFAKSFDKIVQHLKNNEAHMLKNYFGTKFSFAPVILLSWIWLGIEKGFYW
jgi:prepilin peptidase CpaA